MYWVYNEDMFNLLEYVQPNSVDCVITDPPYAVIGDQFEWDNISDIIGYTQRWYSLILKVLKPNSSIYVFWSQKYLKEGLDIFKPKRVLIWHHPNLAKPTNKMYLYTYDFIFYIEIGSPKFHADFTNKTNVDVFTYPKPQANWKDDLYRYHPASKPVRLIENLIKNSTDTGDIILDPFMGGGTTGVASVRLGRKFIGFEKEKEYFKIALERIEREARQTHLLL